MTIKAHLKNPRQAKPLDRIMGKLLPPLGNTHLIIRKTKKRHLPLWVPALFYLLLLLSGHFVIAFYSRTLGTLRLLAQRRIVGSGR